MDLFLENLRSTNELPKKKQVKNLFIPFISVVDKSQLMPPKFLSLQLTSGCPRTN